MSPGLETARPLDQLKELAPKAALVFADAGPCPFEDPPEVRIAEDHAEGGDGRRKPELGRGSEERLAAVPPIPSGPIRVLDNQ